ncbi:hypothetical protein ACLB2K_016464 [Fragaria x ananassa]
MKTLFWEFISIYDRGLVSKSTAKKSDREIQRLINCYVPKLKKFKFGNKLAEISVPDVQQIFGLQNPKNGLNVPTPLEDSKKPVDNLVVQDFFHNEVRITKSRILDLRNAEIMTMKKYNWAKGVRDYLLSCMTTSEDGRAHTSSGCVVLSRSTVLCVIDDSVLRKVESPCFHNGVKKMQVHQIDIDNPEDETNEKDNEEQGDDDFVNHPPNHAAAKLKVGDDDFENPSPKNGATMHDEVGKKKAARKNLKKGATAEAEEGAPVVAKNGALAKPEEGAPVVTKKGATAQDEEGASVVAEKGAPAESEEGGTAQVVEGSSGQAKEGATSEAKEDTREGLESFDITLNGWLEGNEKADAVDDEDQGGGHEEFVSEKMYDPEDFRLYEKFVEKESREFPKATSDEELEYWQDEREELKRNNTQLKKKLKQKIDYIKTLEYKYKLLLLEQKGETSEGLGAKKVATVEGEEGSTENVATAGEEEGSARNVEGAGKKKVQM